MGRLVAELIRMRALGLGWETYEEGLGSVFGAERVAKALAILEGRDYLIDVTLHGEYAKMLAMFDRLEAKKEGMAR